MAQLFLEIKDPQLSPNLVHLQIYSYNDMLLAAFRQKLRAFFPFLKLPIKAVLERMLVMQGYLHSNSSPRILATLSQSEQDGRSELQLEAQCGEVDVHAVIASILRKLRKHRSHFNAIPLPLMMHIAKPGRSTHSGGSFPMRADPGELETDCLGRPTGFRKVHVVDASVFPEIAATTVTLTVMANAHRIGSAYHET
jgi:choline dehydrogenase-like flavoprotein